MVLSRIYNLPQIEVDQIKEELSLIDPSKSRMQICVIIAFGFLLFAFLVALFLAMVF